MVDKLLKRNIMKTSAASEERTQLISDNMKNILNMLFTPLAKYLLFSARNEKGFFRSTIHQEGFTEGKHRGKKMSKARAQVSLAAGEIDDFELFHIELNLPVKTYRKVLKFEEAI